MPTIQKTKTGRPSWRFFTPENQELLRLYREKQGLSLLECTAKFNSKIGYDAVAKECAALGLVRGGERKRKVRAPADQNFWTDERVAELRRLFASGLSFRKIAKNFEKSAGSISGKLGRLGLWRTKGFDPAVLNRRAA